MKVGLGFDAHAFDPGRTLILGGVEILGSAGLAGHSDADVLCHAIGDAALGAVGLGDIGEWFPETDEWAGASSIEILRDIAAKLKAEGWKIANVDATVVAQRPRLSDHKEAMRERIAVVLGVDMESVSVKATTTDGMGSIGRSEGIAAMAIVTVDLG